MALKARLHGKNLQTLSPELYERVAAQCDISTEEWKTIDLDSLDKGIKEELVAALPLLAKMVDPTDDLAANKAFN